MYQGEFVMTGSGPAVVGHSFSGPGLRESEEVESRFGRVTIRPDQSIHFPNGLLGIPERQNYCLTHFPLEKMARFKLLQSVEDHTLSFITLPVELKNPIVEQADLEHAARDLGLSLDDLAVLFVVTVHRESGAAKLSINARAPILMSVASRQAAQYVFPHTKYMIRQPLSL